MSKSAFKINILDIQPSQLYISSIKLKNVLDWLSLDILEVCEPIPVKELNGRIIFTDGHTRAFAIYQMGIDDITVYWDEDELDWEAYQICVDWCIDEGITNISDLEQRMISNELYEVLWNDRCRIMQEELEAKRKLKQ